MVVSPQNPEVNHINARRSDAFDIFSSRQYVGPNPYLDRAAFVFDFALTGQIQPLPLADYVDAVSDRYPQFSTESYESYAHLFARTAAEVNKLGMDLHFEHWSIQPHGEWVRIAIECLHERTGRAVVYSVWDWFEAITQGKAFYLEDQIEVEQAMFCRSVYGGPTVYTLLRTAHQKGIPTFYLWDEGLMQYGYGKKQVRGVATTFDGDSHLDSDFTIRKDDCKDFLGNLGFPVPKGDVVTSVTEALDTVDRIGYPVAVKPVDGHKGLGVTTNVQSDIELETAYRRAVQAIPEDRSVRVIVETSLAGQDYRILCVNGRFLAAIERRPAYVVGDGESTIQELVDRENRSHARKDTPTSALGKIEIDEAVEIYLQDQGLSLDDVIERDRTIYLRKVANLSAGGLSIDATRTVHPDNIILAQDIAHHFRLTCLGIYVIAANLAKSRKQGGFGIIEINAAPGISMHLNPAIGEPVDVTSAILDSFFESDTAARIPIISFNRVTIPQLQTLIDHILLHHPNWTIGAVCREGVFVNREQKNLHRNYNTNVQNLLRHPCLDLLIAEYCEEILERDGMFYYGSNLVVLDNPTKLEQMLQRDALDPATIVTLVDRTVTIQQRGLIEQYQLGTNEPFQNAYLKELAAVL
jgi:cyanophycin synthetase